MSSVRSQGRQPDREDVQTIEQVFTKSPLLDHRLEIAIAGGDDAHVGRMSSRAAQALEPVLLQDPQQLDLHIDGQLADLVEE